MRLVFSSCCGASQWRSASTSKAKAGEDLPARIVQAVARPGRAPFVKHANETPPSEIGLSEILRHKAEPETGKRRVKNLKDTVEDELAFNPRSQFAAVLLELPCV